MENIKIKKHEEVEHNQTNEKCLCPTCGEDKNVNGFVKKRLSCRKCINAKMRAYKQNNKEAISKYNKQYKLEHTEEISEYNAKYNTENRETIQKRHSAYLKEKYKTDEQYKLSCSIRNRIGKVLKGQDKKQTLEMLGCSYEFLKAWLEFQFEEDMTFKNHGTMWHIDHIVPCRCFDLTNNDEKLKCFHWSNLKPMYASENMAKKYAVEKELTENSKNIKKFLKEKKIDETPKLNNFDRTIYLKKL